jgi:hypothetical protein
MPLTRGTILVVAHDAGGGAVLAAVMSSHEDAFDWKIAVAGPAIGSFGVDSGRVERRVFAPEANADLVRWMRDLAPALVLTGTGWQTSFELDAIRAARSLAIPSAAVLDHWVNFRERFGNPATWKTGLPDHILVGDRYARDRALGDGFPAAKLVQMENPYLGSFLAGMPLHQTNRTEVGKSILFISEPTQISFPWQAPVAATRGWEFDAVKLLASYVELKEPELRLKVRLHPSEHRDKYRALDETLRRVGAVVAAASDRSLQDEIREAAAVFGIGSMALLAACAMGCPVATILPPDGTPILPHSGIANCHNARDIAAFLDAHACPHTPLDLALFEDQADVVLARLLRAPRQHATRNRDQGAE